MSKKFSSDGLGGDYFGSEKWGGKSTSTYHPCYETHPSLSLGNGLVVYGGSCGNPMVEDADIYVALQAGSTSGKVKYPWDQKGKDVIEVQYGIQDMSVPKTPATFKKMIEWLAEQIKAGKKVHVGCIGGHGRTGIVLSALVKVMTGEEDAVTYVRKHYCDHAVESSAQSNFLHEHFGIKKVKGYKDDWKKAAPVGGYSNPYPKPVGVGSSGGKQKSLAFSNSTKEYRPAPSKRNVWGPP